MYTIKPEEWTIDVDIDGHYHGYVNCDEYGGFIVEFKESISNGWMADNDSPQGTPIVQFYGTSNTYSGDNCYFMDIMNDGHCRPYLKEFSGHFVNPETGEAIGTIELPNETIEELQSYEQMDNKLYSDGMEFCEYAAAHGLKTDTYEASRQNVGAWLCCTKVGGMAYGFGNVPQWRIDELVGAIDYWNLLDNVA